MVHLEQTQCINITTMNWSNQKQQNRYSNFRFNLRIVINMDLQKYNNLWHAIYPDLVLFINKHSKATI
jgi:hypothetical protein